MLSETAILSLSEIGKKLQFHCDLSAAHLSIFESTYNKLLANCMIILGRDDMQHIVQFVEECSNADLFEFRRGAAASVQSETASLFVSAKYTITGLKIVISSVREQRARSQSFQAEFLANWEALKKMTAQRLLARIPSEVKPSDREMRRIEKLVAELMDEHPTITENDLLYYLLIRTIRPRERGRKPRWSGFDGKALVELLNFTMESMGLDRTKRKGLRRAIDTVRRCYPDRYGKYSEERLRKVYYESQDVHQLSENSLK